MALLLLPLPACISAGPRNYENENDALRAENLKLQRTVEELDAKLAAREGELDALRQQVHGTQPLPGVPTPTLASLKLDRYSGPIDTDGDGRDDLLRLYLQPLDAHGRLYPAEGKAAMKAVDITSDPPVTLAERSYESREFRAAYRQGLTGRHFTLELRLPGSSGGASEVVQGARDIAVHIIFTDAATGATHKASATYQIRL